MKTRTHRVESRLAEEYEAVLRDYLGGTGETALERAYELGRRALAEGLGALDMAKVHHGALEASMPALTPDAPFRAVVKAAAKLFVESMTPYEMTHRGFRETNAALRLSEARYRELFENANDIIFTADLEGNITSVNRAGERLSGYPRSEALSMTFTAVVAPEYVERARVARELKLSGQLEATRYELEILAKDGRRVPLELDTRLICKDGKPVGVQGIARDITERKQAQQALHRLNARLEEEARRIAHALHDQAGQLLTSVCLAVAEIAGELPEEHREQLQRVSTLLDQVAEQLRDFSHELRPVLLDDFGLVPALEFLAKGISTRTALAVTIHAAVDRRFPPPIETALYRILQEALTNVSKHAQAERASVRIEQDARTITCSVVDDGIGFDPSAACPIRDEAGLGLMGMRERLAAFGGTLSITTGRGLGTTLKMIIPLTRRPDH